MDHRSAHGGGGDALAACNSSAQSPPTHNKVGLISNAHAHFSLARNDGSPGGVQGDEQRLSSVRRPIQPAETCRPLSKAYRTSRQRLAEETIVAAGSAMPFCTAGWPSVSAIWPFASRLALQECLTALLRPRGRGGATRQPGSECSQSPLPSAEAFWEAIRQSDTARVVLPDDETDLERAAVRFLQRLTPLSGLSWTRS